MPIPYYSYFKLAETLYGVPWALLAGIALVESGMDPGARGQLGEVGLMQIMVSTWEEWGQGDPFSPKDNILSAARYLRWLIANLDARGRGTWIWTLVAYNWGIGNTLKVSSWDDVPLTPYAYVEHVIGNAKKFVAMEAEELLKGGWNGRAML